MGEDLKIKASPLLVVTRIVVFVLLAVSFVLGYFGMVDMRTDEQKITDYREELLSRSSAQYAIEAIKLAKRNNDYIEITAVNMIVAPGKILLMVYGSSATEKNLKTCYDAQSKKIVNSRLYDDIYYSKMASNNYVGKEDNDFLTKYEGNDLKILLEEAE